MKFPPDQKNREQSEAYAAIAGDERKVVEMKSTDCDCSQENQQSKVPVEQMGWAAAAASALMYILTRGRSPARRCQHLLTDFEETPHGTTIRPGRGTSQAASPPRDAG